MILLKNTTATDITIGGVVISASSDYTMQASDHISFSMSDELVTRVGSGDIIVNDGTKDLGPADGMDLVKGFYPKSVEIADKDADTNGVKVTNNFAPAGFYQRLHEIEFTTAKAREAANGIIDGAIHDKDINNIDNGYSTVEFYEDVAGVETLIDLDILADDIARQAKLDADCIRTDFKFMPTVDYMIKSGTIAHDTIPASEVYLWGTMLDTDPSLQAMGIFPIPVLDGGLALSFVSERTPVGLKGVNGSLLYYSGVNTASGFIATPPGLGTNRIRFICRHSAGFKHRFQAIFEVFIAP